MKPLPKVFVVDDDPAVLSSIEALLTAQSYDVKCFASAEEFIAQHDPTHVGCVVIDLSTAATDGGELIRHLHETQSLLSVVIISGLIDSAIPRPHGTEPAPIVAKACEVWILLTMIEDAIAGSLKRDRVSMPAVSSPVDSLHRDGVNVPAKDKVLKLSPRQREVLSCLLAGDSMKEGRAQIGAQRTHGGRLCEANLQALFRFQPSPAIGPLYLGRAILRNQRPRDDTPYHAVRDMTPRFVHPTWATLPKHRQKSDFDEPYAVSCVPRSRKVCGMEAIILSIRGTGYVRSSPPCCPSD